MTVFTQSNFTVFESSYFNLQFSIKQSEVGWKFAEQWLTKAKVSEPAGEQMARFFKKCAKLKHSYCFIKKFSGA